MPCCSQEVWVVSLHVTTNEGLPETITASLPYSFLGLMLPGRGATGVPQGSGQNNRQQSINSACSISRFIGASKTAVRIFWLPPSLTCKQMYTVTISKYQERKRREQKALTPWYLSAILLQKSVPKDMKGRLCLASMCFSNVNF